MKNIRIYLTLVILAVTVMAGIYTSDNTDAVDTGTASSPLSGLSISAEDLDYASTFYIYNGSSVSITQFSEYMHSISITAVTSGYGLSVSSGSLSGTLTNIGTITITVTDSEMGQDTTYTRTIYSVASPTYTIYFNANGGTDAPATITQTISSSSATITLPASEPERDGYSFRGWDTSSSGTTVVYETEDDVTLPINGSYSITLYAVWREYYNYLLYYDANGGSGAPGYQSYLNTFSTSYTFTVSSTTPTRTDYNFAGWSENSSASSPSYYAGDQITLNSSKQSTTLYAVWTAVTNCTLTINANNSGYGTVTGYYYLDSTTKVYFSGSTTKPSGTTVGIYAVANSGYEFKNWTDSNGNNRGELATLEFTLTATETYTANFRVQTYEIGFTIASGYGSISPAYIDSIPYNSTVTVSGNTITVNGVTATATPATGYSFTSWNGISNGDTITADMTVTATFTINKYPVYFSASTGGSVSPTVITNVPYGSTVTVSSNTITVNGTQVTATRNTGYIFSSWSDVPSTITGSVTITANFTRAYTVSFSSDSHGSVSPASITNVPTGSSITVSSNTITINGTTVTATANTGYSFSKWTYNNASGSTVSGGTVTSAVTIYANFTVNYYTVTLSAGTGGLVSPASLSVPYGSSVSVSNNVLTITAGSTTYTATATADTGYYISSWSKVPSTITGTTTITVSFTHIKLYAATADSSKGGSCAYRETSDGVWVALANGYDATPGTTYRVVAVAMTGYVFDYWEDSEGNIIEDESTYDFTMPNSNYTLTAYFRNPILTYSVNNSDYGTISARVMLTTTTIASGDEVAYNTVVGLYPTAVSGYSVLNFTDGDGTVIADDGGIHSFLMPAYDYTVIVNFISTVLTFGTETEGGGTVTGQAYNGTTLTYEDITSPYNAKRGIGIKLTATENKGYIFTHWEDGDGTELSTDATYQFAMPVHDYTVMAVYDTTILTVQSSNSEYGGTSQYTYLTISGESKQVWFATPYYAQYGDTYYVNAVPAMGMVFENWTDENGTVVSTDKTYSFVMPTHDYTLTANFTLDYGITHWNNGEYNGSVSILYHMATKTGTYDIHCYAELYSYDESAATKFTLNGYEVTYNLHYEDSNTNLTASLIYDGNTVLTASKDLGDWSNVIVVLDPYEHKVYYTLANQFKSFVNYGTRGTYDLLEWTSILPTETMTVYEVDFNTEWPAPEQEVINTKVFLNTYGVVMIDPTFDIDTYWPDMTNIRMNFFSFALYGNDITINGRTFDVDSSKITVQYIVKDSNELYLSKYTDDEGRTHTVTVNGDYTADYDVKEREITLTNFYVTWESGHCYLTFLNDNNWVIDLGTYDNREISMSGMWYFQSGVYESYTVTGTEYVKDWNVLSFDFTFFIIIVLGLLILAGVILRVRSDAKIGDYLIIIGAIAIAITVLGGLAT